MISGVSSGIGLSLARYLNGEEIWGISRRAPTVDLGIRFSYCNVTDWLAVSRVASELQKTWDSLDAIIHCAATQGAIGPAMEVDPEKWLLSLSANVDGAYYVMRAFFEQLVLSRKKGRAKIVLFSGGGAAKPRPNFSAYGAAKTALVRLTETLAEEWAKLPVDINIVAPGAINTAMTREVVGIGPEKAGEIEFKRAVQQLQQGGDSVERLHELVRFLLSAESNGLSGRFLSAQWDSLEALRSARDHISKSDAFTLRRTVLWGKGRILS